MHERLSKFIEVNYKTKTSFAEVVGVNKTAVTPWVYGKYLPSAEVLAKFYSNAGLNINWLLTGEGSMFADNETGRELAAKHNLTVVEPDNVEPDIIEPENTLEQIESRIQQIKRLKAEIKEIARRIGE